MGSTAQRMPDIVVRVARNAIIEKATEGSLYSNCICLFVYYMLIFSYTNSSGVDLTVAYASIMNPIQLANPVAAGNMPSCDALHSAYSRRRLSMFHKYLITMMISICLPSTS